MRAGVSALVATFTAVALTACSGGTEAASPDDPIHIAGLLDETGAAAPYGIAALNGANLAFQQVNDDGGINGRLIEFTQEDAAFDVGQATTLFQRFAADPEIMAIVGPDSDTISTPLTPIINRAEIVSLITSGAGGRPNSEFGPWLFSIPVRNDFLVDRVAEELKNQDLTRVAVVYSTTRPFAVAARDYFATAAEDHGLEIVGDPIGYADGDINFDTVITEIKSRGDIDAIFCSCLAAAAGPMILQADRDGLDARWASDASLLDPGFFELSQGTANGTIVATPYDPTSNPVAREFADAFAEEYGREPNVYDAYGYDTARVLIAALESIEGEITREAVREAVATVSVEAPSGTIEFPDGQGVASRAQAYMNEMRDGKFVPIEDGS